MKSTGLLQAISVVSHNVERNWHKAKEKCGSADFQSIKGQVSTRNRNNRKAVNTSVTSNNCLVAFMMNDTNKKSGI